MFWPFRRRDEEEHLPPCDARVYPFSGHLLSEKIPSGIYDVKLTEGDPDSGVVRGCVVRDRVIFMPFDAGDGRRETLPVTVVGTFRLTPVNIVAEAHEAMARDD